MLRRKLPGVSTIINSAANKDFLIQWAWKLGMEGKDFREVRDASARVGTLAHHLVESATKEKPPASYMYSPQEIETAEKCLKSYQKWAKEHKIQPLEIEKTFTSEKGFCGKVDFYGLVDGEYTLIDYITGGNGVYDDKFIQVSAYHQLLTENGKQVDKMGVLWLGRDDYPSFEYKLRTPDEIKDFWTIFSGCLDIYYAKRRLGI